MHTRVKSTRTIAMDWACAHCGARNHGLAGIEAESLRCLTCGHRKGETERYVMPTDTSGAPTVTSARHLAYAAAGANWTCAFCHAEERASHDHCSACGAAAAGAPPAASAPAAKPTPCPNCLRAAGDRNGACVACYVGGPTAAAPPAAAPPTARPTGRQPTSPYREPIVDAPPPRRPNWHLFLVAATCVLAAAWLLVWLFSPRTTVATVTGNAWHRVESIRQRQVNHGEGWEDDAPANAYEEHCETRQNGTAACHPHDCNCHAETYACRCTGGDSYECDCHEHERCRSNRNGSATCTTTETCSTCRTPRSCDTCTRTACDTCWDRCPVYAQWCTYAYDTWPEIQHRETGGTDQHVAWPGLVVTAAEQRLDRSETYGATLAGDGRTWTYAPRTESEYRAFPVGARWNVEYTYAGTFTPLRAVGAGVGR